MVAYINKLKNKIQDNRNNTTKIYCNRSIFVNSVLKKISLKAETNKYYEISVFT